MTRIDIELLQKQWEFLNLGTRETLFSGCWGGGKSRILCILAVARASNPGAVEGLCRRTLSRFKKSTLRTLLYPDGDLPPVLPPGSYKHYKQDHIIDIHGGGSIMYFGIDAVEDVGSINLTGLGIDEVIELTEDQYLWCTGRPRMKVAGLPNRIYSATNPGAPAHHLAKRFGVVPGAASLPQCSHVVTSALENPHLPEDYVEYLLSLTGVRKDRYVLGKWVAAEGLVYGDWSEANIVHRERSDFERFVVGVDDGSTNPFAVIVSGVDNDGRIHHFEEHGGSGIRLTERVAALKAIDADWHPEAFVIDDAAKDLLDECIAAGLFAVPANKGRVEEGINRVRDRIVPDKDGKPRLTSEPGLTRFAEERSVYQLKPQPRALVSTEEYREEPIKQCDHWQDAERYMVGYVDAGGAGLQFYRIGG